MAKSPPALLIVLLLLGLGCSHRLSGKPTGDRSPLPAPRFIVGQDLDAIRGYIGSGCCPEPDALTACIGLYELLNAESNYGGLGIDTA